MLNVYVSRNFVVSEEAKRLSLTEGQVMRFMLGEVLVQTGRMLQRAAKEDGVVKFPANIRVEVKTELWDTDIRLHMEEENAEAVHVGVDQDALDTNGVAEAKNNL